MSERSFRERFKQADVLNTLLFGGKAVLEGVPFDRMAKTAKVALAAVDTGGGLFSWLNPEGQDIIISEVILDVTTVATGACSVSVGTTTASATTSSANLIDTLDVHSATGSFGSPSGSGGKNAQSLAAGGWVTGSQASGATAGIVGFAYIRYIIK